MEKIYPTKEEMQQWIDALRSGKFRQTAAQLQRDSSFCCLGVACKLFIPEDKQILTGSGRLSGNLPPAQPNAPAWLAGFNEDICNVAFMNDSGQSFEQIADHLEKRVLPNCK